MMLTARQDEIVKSLRLSVDSHLKKITEAFDSMLSDEKEKKEFFDLFMDDVEKAIQQLLHTKINLELTQKEIDRKIFKGLIDYEIINTVRSYFNRRETN